MVFSFYFFVRGICGKKNGVIARYILPAVLIAALATLVRPTNGILMVAYCLYALYAFAEKGRPIIGLALSALMCSIFIIIFIPWTVRNYTIMKMIIPLETYNIQHPFDGQGYKDKGMREWQRAWGPPQDILKLHYDMLDDLAKNNGYKSIDSFIEKEVPSRAYAGYTKEDLRSVLIEYQECIKIDVSRNGGARLKWGETPNICEYEVGNKLSGFAEKISVGSPFLFYLEAPIFHRGLKYVLHSGLHTLKSFQGDGIGLARKVVKSYAYMVNICLWSLSLIFLISPVSMRQKILLGVFVASSFIFHIAFLHVEGRYMLSSYPFLYLMSSIYVWRCPMVSDLISRCGKTSASGMDARAGLNGSAS